jgi:hypothetical protein
MFTHGAIRSRLTDVGWASNGQAGRMQVIVAATSVMERRRTVLSRLTDVVWTIADWVAWRAIQDSRTATADRGRRMLRARPINVRRAGR